MILITLRDLPHTWKKITEVYEEYILIMLKINDCLWVLNSIWGRSVVDVQNPFRLAKLRPTNCLIKNFFYIYINVLPVYFLLYPYKWINKSMYCRNNLPPVGRTLNEWVTIKFRAKGILSKEVGGKQQWRAWAWLGLGLGIPTL